MRTDIVDFVRCDERPRECVVTLNVSHVLPNRQPIHSGWLKAICESLQYPAARSCRISDGPPLAAWPGFPLSHPLPMVSNTVDLVLRATSDCTWCLLSTHPIDA